MEIKQPAVNTTPAAAPENVAPTTTPTKTEELESQITALETAKAKAVEEASNYKVAFLKEKSRNEGLENETEEEKIQRIVHERLTKEKIEKIDSEKDRLLKELLKENKELKLAHLNKPANVPPSSGSGDAPVVKDTVVTQEQLNAFKARGWSDKDIERYKKNLNRYGGR